MQLAMFQDEQPKADIRYIEVTTKPSIQWVFDNARKAFRSMSGLSEKDFIKVWKAVGLAAYMFRRNIEPKGFVWSRHKHLIHQLGSQELVNKVESEFKKRALDKRIGLDISITE
jgi:hypothetical protein